MFYTNIPEVHLTQNLLHLETSKIFRTMCLGLYRKRVDVDRSQKVVHIEAEWLWGYYKQSSEFQFSQIMDVETGYEARRDKNGSVYYEIFKVFLKIRKEYSVDVKIAEFGGPSVRLLFFSADRHKKAFHDYYDHLLEFLGRKNPIPSKSRK